MKLQNISRVALASLITFSFSYSSLAQNTLINTAMNAGVNTLGAGIAVSIAATGSNFIIREQMKIVEYNKFVSFFSGLNSKLQELRQLDSSKSPGPIVSLSSDGSSRGFWYIDSNEFAGLVCKGELPSVTSSSSGFLATTAKAQQNQSLRCQRDPYNSISKLKTKAAILAQDSILNDFSKITNDSEQTAVQMYQKIEQSLYGSFFYIDSVRISLEADLGANQRNDLAIYKVNVRITERNRNNKKAPRECSAHVEINKKNTNTPSYFRYWGCI